MTLRIPAKVLLHVWSYDFCDMTLSTGKQRRHMINELTNWSVQPQKQLQACCFRFKKKRDTTIVVKKRR